MTSWFRPRSREFDLPRQRRTLHGWKDECGIDRLAVIEQDERGLIRQLAEARLALDEHHRQHQENTRDVLLSLLEIGDICDEVLADVGAKADQVSQQTKKWIGRFRTASKLLKNVLSDQSVSQFETQPGQVFDPVWHRAVGKVSGPDGTVGIIVKVVNAGYLWRGELLRKAGAIVQVSEDQADDIQGA